jgi:hypothetical protein
VSLTRQCPPHVARTMTRLLVGDEYAALPANEAPIHPYFATMSLEDALEEFDQVYQLPESERLRDLMQRMEEEASA